MSFAISISGCIFGLNFKRTQLWISNNIILHLEPEKERCANRERNTHHYACHLCQPTHRVYNGLPDWRSQMGCDKQRVKNGCTNKLKAKCSRNQYGLAEILCRNPEYFQRNLRCRRSCQRPNKLKEAFNMRMKDTSEEQPEEAPVGFWEVFVSFKRVR